MAVFALALFAMTGLVVDGGRLVASRVEAQGLAEAAARLGAAQISADALRAGVIELNPSTAQAVAQAFIDKAGWSGNANVTGEVVEVHVSTVEPTAILGLLGISQLHPSATAFASNVHGITRQDR